MVVTTCRVLFLAPGTPLGHRSALPTLCQRRACRRPHALRPRGGAESTDLSVSPLSWTATPDAREKDPSCACGSYDDRDSGIDRTHRRGRPTRVPIQFWLKRIDTVQRSHRA